MCKCRKGDISSNHRNVIRLQRDEGWAWSLGNFFKLKYREDCSRGWEEYKQVGV